MTRCPLLVTMGCEIHGYEEASRELATLEVKAIRELASPEEIDRLRVMLDQWGPVIELGDAIFGASYYCDPRIRTIREKNDE